MPDARHSLSELRTEWESCRRCPLGVHREAVQGAFVAGEGDPGGIMFIGEGPGWQEEAQGRPFIGRSGKILRGVIERLGLDRYYISNVVACRSCEQASDAMGQPLFRQHRGIPVPKIVDVPPPPQSVEACLPRLHEEIYRVDPIVIVTLGVPAAEALLKRRVAITKEAGHSQHISIPGAAWVPSLTDKKGAWARKAHGQLVAPIEQNEVRYLLIPTLHPAFILRKIEDRGPMSPFQEFVRHIRMAVHVYERYMLEVYGHVPTSTSNVSDEVFREYQEKSTEDE